MPIEKQFMGIDQFGNTFHSLGSHPRKGLMTRLGFKHAVKMYQDFKDGTSAHTGYVVGPHWVTLYEVIPMRKEMTKLHHG